MKKKKVSIIINCYNSERYLKETLMSLIAQTHKDWELIFMIITLMIIVIKYLKCLKIKDLNIINQKNLRI